MATRHGVTEPRIYTPPLRDLADPAATLGHSVIAFADQVLGINLLPWQQWLLLHMLELLPDGTLRFRTVVILMARQNGKSTLSQVLALWFMYVYGTQLVLGTAQDLDTAEEVWQGAVDLVLELGEDDEPLRPELHDLLDRVVMVNGKKSLVLKSGERYKVKAANRRAGRGLSGDVVLLDELREHQSWDAWGAITKTTMARAQALVLALSNAGDATSVVLRYLRRLAHDSLGDPDGLRGTEAVLPAVAPEDEDQELADDDSLAIFEWSAPAGCSVQDRDGWAMANPSLGYTISERTIASACRTDPEWIFRTEVLCQWSDGTLEGPFPTGAWEACGDPASQRAPGAPLALAVDVSWDRSTTHVALASTRADGLPHVEVIASRAGTDWVVPWLAGEERHADLQGAPIALQAKGAPVSSLAVAMTEAGLNVVEWGGSALGAATGALYDRVRAAVGEGEATPLRHRNQPLLNLAAATASTRPVGDAWLWDRKRSSNDPSPLIAVTGALWCLTSALPPPPRVSAYETSRLEVF